MESPLWWSNTSNKDLALFQAQFLSHSISQTGGMHRHMDHTLQITVPQGLRQWEATVYVLLYITSDVFVDVDDPFDTNTIHCSMAATQCHVSLFHPTNDTTIHTPLIIDIEQPSFVSPPHVLLVQVHVATQTYNVGTIQLHFTTKLHVRYPPPIQSNNTKDDKQDNIQTPLTILRKQQPTQSSSSSLSSSLHHLMNPNDRYWILYLPTPIIVGATYRLNDESLPNRRRWKAIRTYNHIHSEFESIVVAAGSLQDYFLVVTVTILACLGGCVVMLSTMAHISQWN